MLARHVPWILKLTVDPGYAGQAIKSQAFESIRRLRNALQEEGLDVGIQADGNVNTQTIPQLVHAGADMLTGGTSGLFVRNASIADNALRLLDTAKLAAAAQ
jgi:ribulose-phosphate 3-epimerase